MQERSRKWLGAGSALLAAGILVGSQQLVAQSTADILARRDSGDPLRLWVSAADATTDAGKIRWEGFDPAGRATLRAEVLQSADLENAALQPVGERAPYLSEDLCSASTVIFSHFGDERPRDTWEDLVRYARGIFAARIVAIEQGFLGGLPESLLEVQIEEVIRPSRHFATSPRFFISYPYAVFAVGDQIFCRKYPKFSYRPQVGDRLLLFPSHRPVDLHALLLVLEPSEILAETPAGQLHLPEILRGEKELLTVHDFASLQQRAAQDEPLLVAIDKDESR